MSLLSPLSIFSTAKGVELAFVSVTLTSEVYLRFLNTDYAWRHAILQRGIPSAEDLKNLSSLFSYDISCHYEVNADDRFSSQNELADVAPVVEKFDYCVPLVHVSNHKDNCMYEFSSAYKLSAGHFHGETAEQPWPYFNPFGGQGRQMSNGARQDMYIDAATFWNHMKEIGLSTVLST